MSLETILGLLGKSICILVFYVHLRILWVIHTSLTADFERIQYDTPFQPHTISSKNIEASSSMRWSRTICQAAQIWSKTIKNLTMVNQQMLCFQMALKNIGDMVAPIFLAEVNVHTHLGQYNDLHRSMVCRIIHIRWPQNLHCHGVPYTITWRFHEISSCWIKISKFSASWTLINSHPAAVEV